MTHRDAFRRFLAPRSLALWGAAVLLVGCGGNPDATDGAGAAASASGEGGLMLPPGFQPVDLPREKRVEIYHDAARVRALAVQEANQKLPMDEAHLPIGKTAEFEKRVADHKKIIDEILERNLADLAKKHGISAPDLAKIEEEASRLRWLPPSEPVLEKKKADAPKAAPAEAPAKDDTPKKASAAEK